MSVIFFRVAVDRVVRYVALRPFLIGCLINALKETVSACCRNKIHASWIMVKEPLQDSFVVSLLTQDNDYQVEQAASAEDAARALGVDVQIIYADNDSILQSQQILKFIQGDQSRCRIRASAGQSGSDRNSLLHSNRYLGGLADFTASKEDMRCFAD